MTPPLQRFVLTDDHVKLLRAMYVGWCDDEFGAPEIDPKRPYGNSSVLLDIHEMLAPDRCSRCGGSGHIGVFGVPSGATCPACLGTGSLKGRDDLTPELEERYRALHEETQTALQVVFATGSFAPGVYVADQYRKNWERVEEEAGG